MKSRKLIYVVFVLLVAVYFKFTGENTTNVTKNTTSNKAKNDADGVNDTSSNFNYLPTSTTNQIIEHDYYTLSYNEKYEQAEWAAYELTPSYLTKDDRTRPYFIYDKEVRTKSANYRNYKNSGYDKGHLVSAGDMRFSKEAFDDTFFTSNISPQNHEFNAGIWNRLEQKVRYWTYKNKHLYIITGGVLKPNLKKIGKEQVAVPNQFYKIVLDYTEPEIKAIAFLMDNKESKDALYKHVTSIDDIEKLTGIDFFSALPDDIEKELEQKSDYKGWSFR